MKSSWRVLALQGMLSVSYMVCKYFFIGSKKKKEMLLSLLFTCVLSSVI